MWNIGRPNVFHAPLFALQLQICCSGHTVSCVTWCHHQMYHRLHLWNLFCFNKLHYSQLTLLTIKQPWSIIIKLKWCMCPQIHVSPEWGNGFSKNIHCPSSNFTYCTCSSCSALHCASPITLFTAYTLIPGGGWGRPCPAALTLPSIEPPWDEEGAGRVGDSFSTKLEM